MPPLRRLRPPLTSAPLEVWAVEDTSIQITWGALPPGLVEASARGRRASVEHCGGPGALDLTGLPADTGLEVVVTTAGTERRTWRLRTRTLAAPPGPELFRFATISDLHIGARRWGFLKTMSETAVPDGGPHPGRCARAALEAARTWGADLVVVKGDAVHHRHPDNFAELGRLFDEFPDLDIVLVPGNHDVDFVHSDVDLPVLGERGLRYVERAVATRDAPGIRIVATDTTKPGDGDGTLGPMVDDVADAVAASDDPVFLAFHHHIHRFDVLTHWPPGIVKADGDQLASRLDAIGRPALVSTGHSHRNRSHRLGPAPITEVASTKDWPGVWAGYVVHEGGIRQVVRRIAAPDTVEWHEYSRGAVLGLWSPWAAGNVANRCLTHTW